LISKGLDNGVAV